MARIIKSTEYLRHDFTQSELLELGGQLAEAYQSLDQIENEEAAIKAQIKERKSGVQLKIGTLSRNISARFDMQNVECRWDYGKPNAGEVSCFRIDTGAFVKARAMTGPERQEEIPFGPVAVNPQTTNEIVEAVATFIVDNGGEGALEKVAEAIEKDMPEASRQTLLTMKGRKKKIIEEQVPIGGDIFTGESSAGKAPSGEDLDF